MIDRLQQMEHRYEELSTQLSLPEIVNDREKYQQAGKALSDLETPVMKFRELKLVRQALEEARAMLSDPAMSAMAEEEIAALAPREPALEEEIKVLLLPKDPNDEKNVILEIRAGTGGDEASLFAAEVFRIPALCRAAPLEDRTAFSVGVRRGRLQGSNRHHRGRARVLADEVGERRASRATRAGDRDARARAHLRHHRRRASRSGRR